MDFLQRLRRQLAQVWAGMSPARRVLLVCAAVRVVAAVASVGYYASMSEYRVLASGLTLEEAAAITAKLQGANTPYRLASGGTTILVPAEQLSQARLTLAAEGLPSRAGK